MPRCQATNGKVTNALAVCQSECRGKSRAHQIFRHARPAQFAGQGRKYRIQQERMRRLARTLATFDPSGNCIHIFAAVRTILRALRAVEERYDTRDRMAWSRRSVFRYLKLLQASGVVSIHGLTRKRGTRKRSLHAEALFSRSFESGTPASRESGTVVLKGSKKKQTPKNRDETPHAKIACDATPENLGTKPKTNPGRPLPFWTIDGLKRPENAVILLNDLVKQIGPTQETLYFLAWALRPTRRDPLCERKIYHPRQYVYDVTQNFYRSFDGQTSILDRMEPDFPGVTWVPSETWGESRWVETAAVASA